MKLIEAINHPSMKCNEFLQFGHIISNKLILNYTDAKNCQHIDEKKTRTYIPEKWVKKQLIE